ncbi:MAG: sulfite exporter TauE/SafE family protein [Pseudomonadota bacterium]|nr:MAG: sulfite exporter TauE/SafE family protein [Pseudomonadota bacterium]
MLDLTVALAGLFVGFVVGLTGMGGGALMTPLLVLLFGIQPLAAVSSDIVASMVMKPVGGAVHWRSGTVNRRLVLWLMLGSVPSAFFGVFLLKSFGTGPEMQTAVKHALGVALFIVASGLVLRPLLTRARAARGDSEAPLQVRPLPTLCIGIVGGLVVGVTSVGSGSLMILMLLMLYPAIRLKELVGTDLVQAVPLVASAAIAHLLFGDFKLSLTASILIGSIPGVYLGARFSSRAPDHVIRPALVVVLLASALKLLGVSTFWVGIVGATLTVVGIAYAVTVSQRLARARVLEAAPARVVETAPAPEPGVHA